MYISIENCKRWIEYPNINPITGRNISTYGRTYELFRKQCVLYELETRSEKSKCESKWILLTSNESSLYDKSQIKHCKYCKKTYSLLHFIHSRDDNSAEDYQCDRCNEFGNLAYFCFKCKNMQEAFL